MEQMIASGPISNTILNDLAQTLLIDTTISLKYDF